VSSVFLLGSDFDKLNIFLYEDITLVPIMIRLWQVE